MMCIAVKHKQTSREHSGTSSHLCRCRSFTPLNRQCNLGHTTRIPPLHLLKYLLNRTKISVLKIRFALEWTRFAEFHLERISKVMESSSMERAQFRLQQLAAHLHPDQGSMSFMPCMGGVRRHSRIEYARAALNDARFMRPAQDTKGNPTEEVKQSAPQSRSPQDNEKSADLVCPPLFSKPSAQQVAPPVSEPLFSRSSSLSPQEVEKEKEAAALAWAAAEEQPSHPETESIGKGYEWFPRMDVVESGSAYVVTVELPGVNVDGICCEVASDSLVISGNRITDWWKNNGDSHSNGNGHGNGSVYHRRDLAQGPYRAVWRLPKNADVGAIAAEFIEGFLRVVVPKTRIVRYV